MKTTFLSIIIMFSCLSLYADEQLYFIRAQTVDNGGFRDGYRPPVQIITYNPSSDTLLQVLNDYTELLNSRQALNELWDVTYYPRFRTFSFSTDFDRFYLLRTNQPDTLVKLIFKYPNGYEISTSGLQIINDHWAYECSTIGRDKPKADYFRYMGLDQSLTNYFDLKATDYKDLYLTASTVQRVELRPNDGHMYLPIVADIENRPPFSVVLPEKYWVDKKTFTHIRVNDEHKTLITLKHVNPSKNEDYGSYHAALYNKNNNTWRDIELKGNAPIIMTYGQWLAGLVQDRSNFETKFYIGNKISPGKAERDRVYAESFTKHTYDYEALTFESLYEGGYCPGILFLYNTETDKYIEWNTQQGDSEILLVEDETVYYRVFNAIYKAPILNGEKLGKSELLVRDDEVVPFIHWAFLSKESEDKPN